MNGDLTKLDDIGAAPPAPKTDLIIAPVVDVQHFLTRRKAVYDLLKEVMIDGHDYMTLPGTEKPMLCKPGAEKLLQFFGLRFHMIEEEIIEDWEATEPFLYYKYRCQAYRGETLVCDYVGICHSRETKYRYRWVPEHEVPKDIDLSVVPVRMGRMSDLAFAIRKKETTGKYGKPMEYWEAFEEAIRENRARKFKKQLGAKEYDAYEIDMMTVRIPNPEVPDLAHTISAIAQKRAIVGTTRYATNASDIFDVSDAVDEGQIVIDGQYSEVTAQEKQQEQEEVRKATQGRRNGEPVDPAQAKKDKEELYGPSETTDKADRKDAINAVRKAYGEANEGKGVPANEEMVKELSNTLAQSDITLSKVAQAVFDTKLTALDEAHVTILGKVPTETLAQI